MVSILDLLHCFSFQFVKNGSAVACKLQKWKVVKFNTNLVQFLPLHHVIISNMHVCSFMWTICDML